MSKAEAHEITQLLLAWNAGNQAAFDRLMPLVHDELRRIARRYMRQERAGHTLQTTALINEAYLQLIDAQAPLGLARAAAMNGDMAKSRKAYQDFFARWKDADADLPILIEAKKEYDRLLRHP